jgi:hypothetical protein
MPCRDVILLARPPIIQLCGNKLGYLIDEKCFILTEGTKIGSIINQQYPWQRCDSRQWCQHLGPNRRQKSQNVE